MKRGISLSVIKTTDAIESFKKNNPNKYNFSDHDLDSKKLK